MKPRQRCSRRRLRAFNTCVTDIAAQLASDGYVILRDAIPPALLAELRDATDSVSAAGVRSLFSTLPRTLCVAEADRIGDAVRGVLGDKAFVTRAILFDKSSDANWFLALHQDKAIAVEARVEVPGFGPWSIKHGVPHVRPPSTVLESMLTVRVHIDDCDAANGALDVVPGSHAQGFLSLSEINQFVDADGPENRRLERWGRVTCACRAGDALLMRPLLLHGSSRSSTGARRRVIHMEYASIPLPGDLQWARA